MWVCTHVPEGAECKHSYPRVDRGAGGCTQVSVYRDDAHVQECETAQLRACLNGGQRTGHAGCALCAGASESWLAWVCERVWPEGVPEPEGVSSCLGGVCAGSAREWPVGRGVQETACEWDVHGGGVQGEYVCNRSGVHVSVV